MPCVPEDLHDMKEEGVELLHGRFGAAVLGNGKVEARSCTPQNSRGDQRVAHHRRQELEA